MKWVLSLCESVANTPAVWGDPPQPAAQKWNRPPRIELSRGASNFHPFKVLWDSTYELFSHPFLRLLSSNSRRTLTRHHF